MSSASTATLLPSPSSSSSSTTSRLMPMPSQHSHSRSPINTSQKLQPAPVVPVSSAHRSNANAKHSGPSLQPAPLAPAASTPLVASPPSAITEKKDGGPLVLPSKEWVLPARAKPGRKPSETEPLTKRKAQNRASQRAFRERKQSYLAELEAKVAAYEKAEIDRSVEMQKLAQKLSAENDSLKKELTSWKERSLQLESILNQARATGTLPPVLPSSRSGPGCRAPSHERPAPKRGALVAPGAKVKERGEVRFADPVENQKPTQKEGHSASSVASVPSKDRPTSNAAISIEPSLAEVATTSPTKHQSVSSTTTKTSKASLWAVQPADERAANGSSAAGRSALETPSKSKDAFISPPLMSASHLHVDGGCGFCTEASPCVCADDFLDLNENASASKAAPSHIPVPSDVPSAVPLPKRRGHPSPPESSARMSIDSLTNSTNVNAGRKAQSKKLWYTVSQQEDDRGASPCAPAAAPSGPLAVSLKPRKAGKKLWYTTEATSTAASNPPEPACTGDPSTCGACSTDPGLAAFCKAVKTATSSPHDSARNHAATRPSVSRSNTTGHLQIPTTQMLYSSSSSARRQLVSGETIPSAWRQISSHPRFSQWQGGLDLLAEVVSKRSGSIHSPLLGERKPERVREVSVEIEPARETLTTSATSNDRATSLSDAEKPTLLPTASDTTIHKLPRVKRELQSDDSEVQESDHKRRRILIDREAVQEALALLDAGIALHPRDTSRKMSISDREDVPCPCPWRPGERSTST